MKRVPLVLTVTFVIATSSQAQEKSEARVWMETVLKAIQYDDGRPTVHARNMFHTSIALYDAWAIYNTDSEPYLLGNEVGTFKSEFQGFQLPDSLDRDSAIDVTIAYAAYRTIFNRFNLYSSKNRVLEAVDSVMDSRGYNRGFSDTDYSTGNPAALGNYIASHIEQFGLQDGSREDDLYESYHYQPVNQPMKPQNPGAPGLIDPNRWQPINVAPYVAEKGLDDDLKRFGVDLSRIIDYVFLSPEWGEVLPFAMTGNDKKTVQGEHAEMFVHLDPGPPPYLDLAADSIASEQYKWGFLLVALWSGLMDPSDGVMIDISPGGIGRSATIPDDFSEFPEYYDLENGGYHNSGHEKNPFTGKPYEPNLVKRGDYARVIAEYWVDGVNTVTPPGHWMTNLHYTTDHPLFTRRWNGQGDTLNLLEWDVKSQFALAGAMHDAAIAAWSVKGYYDYVRPISAIRYMAQKGQCSDSEKPRYHPHGLPLIDGRIEVVSAGDPLAGKADEHVNKIKIKAWKGPEYIKDPKTDVAGVGWILAENWWPYQRYAFTTPPFAGYVSGHSCFSIAGATVLEQICGTSYFPGGLGEFHAKKNEFLIFEDGPTTDVVLQWATFEDAANQTCISRIWGGIHPPADDIPGRKMGKIVGLKAMQKVQGLFDGQ